MAEGPTAGFNHHPVRLEIVLTTDFQELCLPEIYKYCIVHARMVRFQLMGTFSDDTPEPKALFQDHKRP